MVLAIGTLAQVAFSVVYLGMGVLAPELQRELDLSLAATGILISSVNAGALSMMLVWGLLVDRHGERLVVAVGLPIAALALVAAAQADSVGALVAALVVAGAGGSSVMSATGRAVARWFEEGQRGLALGLRQTGVPLGGALAAATLPAIVAAGSVADALYFIAAICAGAGVAGALALRERDGRELAADEGGLEGSPLRDSRIWSLTVGSGLIACAQASMAGFTVLFLHSERGLSLGRAAAVLAAIQLIGTVGRVGLGHLSDRKRDRIRPLVILAALTSIGLAATAALVDAPLGVLVPIVIAAGGVAMSWNALAFTATVEVAGREKSGAALGLQQSALGGVNAVVPLLFAPLVAATSWQLAFALVAALPLAGGLVLRPLASRSRA